VPLWALGLGALGLGAMLLVQRKGGPMDVVRAGSLDGLTTSTKASLERLATLASAEGVPMTVTSGYRSARAQAQAMINKVKRGENIRTLYRSASALVDRLLALGVDDIDGWAALLAASPISAHQRGDAVDLRTRGLSDAEVYRLGELAIEAGFTRALRESDHLHVERRS
jgi:hypothetical protein